jgi:hypothetical protein
LRVSSRLAALFALITVLGIVTAASAHRREDHLQAARLGVEPDSVLVTLDLTPGLEVADSFLAALDRDRDGSLSSEEQRAYAAQVLSALALEVDQRPLRLRLLSWDFPETSAVRRGEGTLRLTIQATLPKLSAAAHRLRFRNAHLAGQSTYLANALVPESALVQVTAQRRAADQSELTIEYTLRGDAPAATRAWLLGGVAAALLLVRFLRAIPFTAALPAASSVPGDAQTHPRE